MSIVRTEHNKQNPYVIINKTALDEQNLSWEAKGLWTFLLSKPDKWQVSVKHLSTHFPAGPDKVRNILNELINAGYCEKTSIKENGKFSSLDYTVYESKKVKEILPKPENPAPVFAGPENTTQTSNEGKVSNDLKNIVCSEEALVAPPSLSIPILRKCTKTHPDGSELHVSIEDVFRLAVNSKTNWSALEIEKAFDILSAYEGDVRTWERFIEGTIQNIRNTKKYAPITKKTQESKCNQQKIQPSNNTCENEKDDSSVNVMSIPAWRNWILEMGFRTKLMKFIKNPKNFLVFCGSPGIGKTFFCACLVEWAMKTFTSFRYWNEGQLLQRLRDGMDGHKGDYLKHLLLLIDDPLIMLDDIGSQGVNEWRAEVIFDAIDYRYNSMLPTVITSNFSKKEFETKYHPRLASRIFDKDNVIIEIHDGKDKRL